MEMVKTVKGKVDGDEREKGRAFQERRKIELKKKNPAVRPAVF